MAEPTYFTPSLDSTPKWRGLHQFMGGFGVNGLGAQSLMDPGVTTYFNRSVISTASGVTLGAHAEYISAAFTNANIGVGFLSDIINQGTASGGGGHLVGLIGRFQDIATSAMAGYGIEGKVIRKGTNDTGAALSGIGDYIGTTFSSRFMNIFSGFAEIFQADGATALTQGTTCVFRGFKPTGGDPTVTYLAYGDLTMQIYTGGKITSANPSDGTKTVAIYQDNTDTWFQGQSGSMRIDPGANYVTIQQGSGLAHLTGGTLGHPSFRWGLLYGTTADFTGAVTLFPAASATPSTNGQMAFEFTSNTQLKIKVKGSDSTVRSTSLTLS